MQSSGAAWKINIPILSMPHEVAVLLKAIDSLLPEIVDGTTVSVLLNGGSDPNLQAQLAPYPFIHYYESPTNLGVAGGRNFLCSTEEARAADVIIFLDNDVIVPRDYLAGMARSLMEDPSIGTAGAVALDFKHYHKALAKFADGSGPLAHDGYRLTIPDLRSLFLKAPTPKGLYHIGTHPNWMLTYILPYFFYHEAMNRLGKRFGKKVHRSTNLKEDSRAVRRLRIEDGRIAVSNVAGCTQAFRRALLDEIGNFDLRFSPYGHEDVDFNVRAIKAGYKNYTLTSLWLLHGTDIRHAQRDREASLENNYRVLTILASKHLPRWLFRPLLLLRIRSNWLLLKLRRNPNAGTHLESQMRGYRKGLSQINGEAAGQYAARAVTKLSGGLHGANE